MDPLPVTLHAAGGKVKEAGPGDEYDPADKVNLVLFIETAKTVAVPIDRAVLLLIAIGELKNVAEPRYTKIEK